MNRNKALHHYLGVEGQHFVWQVLVLFYVLDLTKESHTMLIAITTVDQYLQNRKGVLQAKSGYGKICLIMVSVTMGVG
jgi:hypothetical protein